MHKINFVLTSGINATNLRRNRIRSIRYYRNNTCICYTIYHLFLKADVATVPTIVQHYFIASSLEKIFI
jgi:hypothetical protein